MISFLHEDGTIARRRASAKRKLRGGFSLVEMLCAMALLAVLGFVLAGLLKHTLDAERTQARGFDRLLHTKALADQFRADVAQADDAPKSWQDYVAGPHTLILKMKAGDHVIYLWNKGKLVREATEKGEDVERVLPLDESRVEVEFARADAEPRLIRLRLRTKRDGKTVAGETLEIVAALGGDVR